MNIILILIAILITHVKLTYSRTYRGWDRLYQKTICIKWPFVLAGSILAIIITLHPL